MASPEIDKQAIKNCIIDDYVKNARNYAECISDGNRSSALYYKGGMETLEKLVDQLRTQELV